MLDTCQARDRQEVELSETVLCAVLGLNSTRDPNALPTAGGGGGGGSCSFAALQLCTPHLNAAQIKASIS